MKIKSNIQNLSNYKKSLQVKTAIQQFLNQKGYLEIDLPVLSPSLIPESYVEIFETEFRYMDKKEKLYLTPSPELFLKRLLVDGVGDCYYLGKSFRNSEPNSPKHTPEFTMLEFYKVDQDYKYVAQEVLEMLRFIAKEMTGDDSKITYQGHEISLEQMEELTVAEAFAKYAEMNEIFDQQVFLKRAKEKGYTTEGFTYEDIFSQIYTQEVEPNLGMNGKVTFLYDYPVIFAALSKPNTDGKTAQRFEFYICGLELGNCYGELQDWTLQGKRLKEEERRRKESGKIQHPSDWGFVESLKKGLPDCSGIAIGVDRLTMIFADISDIEKAKLLVIK
ncbi:MAG TPA: hypothetical protein PLS49_05780 [Candidatus Woesebacteria bacterium]|nr:hypothetical protein [Candidatus Woesebacteria bacterium]